MPEKSTKHCKVFGEDKIKSQVQGQLYISIDKKTFMPSRMNFHWRPICFGTRSRYYHMLIYINLFNFAPGV